MARGRFTNPRLPLHLRLSLADAAEMRALKMFVAGPAAVVAANIVVRSRVAQANAAPLPPRGAWMGVGFVASMQYLWVPIIRSWALTRGYALHPGTRNRYEIRYTRTQHGPCGCP